MEVFQEELIAAWEGRDLYRGHAPLRTLYGDELIVLFTLVVPKRETGLAPGHDHPHRCHGTATSGSIVTGQ